jgi:thiol-disulfide isomerase/thioredoxin
LGGAVPPRLTSIAPSVLAARIRESEAKVSVVNVWATWCEPCLEELPDFVRFARNYRDRGVEVLLISGDFESQRPEAQALIERLGVDFETFIRDGGDAELIDALSEAWSGALPVTFIYSRGRKLEKFIEGKVEYPALESEVLRVLGASP